MIKIKYEKRSADPNLVEFRSGFLTFIQNQIKMKDIYSNGLYKKNKESNEKNIHLTQPSYSIPE